MVQIEESKFTQIFLEKIIINILWDN
jgi:hypothetical protein